MAVDEQAMADNQTSLAVDGVGRVHISYHDYFKANLQDVTVCP